MSGFRHRNVPYFSQWADPAFVQRIVHEDADPCTDPTWISLGFPDETTYRFWSPRICGLACLESTLTYWHVPVPSRWNLVDDALAHGAYEVRGDDSVRGLVYAPFLEWVERRFDVTGAVRVDTSLNALVADVSADQLVVASVSPQIRTPDVDPERTGGHLVLIVGFDDEGIEFHNPSGVPPYQANARIPRRRFERYFAHRGFVMRRPGSDRRTPLRL